MLVAQNFPTIVFKKLPKKFLFPISVVLFLLRGERKGSDAPADLGYLLCNILITKIYFWLNDPNVFLKAPLAPKYTNVWSKRGLYSDYLEELTKS